jgi:hypothetical protein
MDFPSFFGIFFAIFSLLVTIGLTIYTTHKPNFRIIHWCSYGSAFCVLLIAMKWDSTTDLSPSMRVFLLSVVGALTFVFLSEALRWISTKEYSHQTAEARAPEKQKIANTINQSGNNSGQIANSIVNLTVNTATNPHSPAHDIDHIYQAGAIVGKVFGARRSPTDATIYEFVEITQAGQFNLAEQFAYKEFILAAQSAESVTGVDSSRPQDGKIIKKMVAKIISSH